MMRYARFAQAMVVCGLGWAMGGSTASAQTTGVFPPSLATFDGTSGNSIPLGNISAGV